MLIIVVNIILWATYGVVFCNQNNSNVYYKVEVIAEINSNYSIIIPVPLSENGSVSSLLNDLSIIEGEGDYDLTMTMHGYGMSLNGSGCLVLYAHDSFTKKEYANEGFSTLSMWENITIGQEDVNRVWVYTADNNSIAVKITHGHKSKIGNNAVIDNIKYIGQNGWNLVNVSTTLEVVEL